MKILGIGVDILHLPRLRSLISRRPSGSSRLAARILSSRELTLWKEIRSSEESEDASPRFLGVRWAIKEAAYKAAYPIIKPTWKELTFAKMEGDVANLKPVLAYHPSRDRAQAREGSGKAAMRMHASVSHDGDYIFATVLVESE